MKKGVLFIAMMLILGACGKPALTPEQKTEVIETLSSLHDLTDTVRSMSVVSSSPKIPGLDGLHPTQASLMSVARDESQREADREELENHLIDQLASGECLHDFGLGQLLHISSRISGTACSIHSDWSIDTKLTSMTGGVDMSATWKYESRTPWFREKSNVKTLEMQSTVKVENAFNNEGKIDGQNEFQVETVTKGKIQVRSSIKGNFSTLNKGVATDLTLRLEGKVGSISFEIVAEIHSLGNPDDDDVRITINGQPAQGEELAQLTDLLIVMAF